MKMNVRSLAVAAVLVALVGSAACAAKTVRDQARVGALGVGESVLALAQVLKVNDGVIKVLYASRAYERAVAAWPDGGTAPEQVDAAKAGLTKALDDLVAIAPQIEAVRQPLLRAIAAVRAALTAQANAHALDGVVMAQTLPGGLVQLFAFANLILSLVSSGRSSFTKIKDILQKAGATDEELKELDDRLSSEIDRRQGLKPPPIEG
jgi:hypothetical protein